MGRYLTFLWQRLLLCIGRMTSIDQIVAISGSAASECTTAPVLNGLPHWLWCFIDMCIYRNSSNEQRTVDNVFWQNWTLHLKKINFLMFHSVSWCWTRIVSIGLFPLNLVCPVKWGPLIVFKKCCMKHSTYPELNGDRLCSLVAVGGVGVRAVMAVGGEWLFRCFYYTLINLYKLYRLWFQPKVQKYWPERDEY